MNTIKVGGLMLAAFVAGAFIASSELRAYAANTIFSTDIVDGEVKTADLANNSVTTAKVLDGQIKTADIGGGAVTNAKLANGAVNSIKIVDSSISAADIAPDAVGASEVAGVSKLIFSECSLTFAATVDAGVAHKETCTVAGVDSDDNIVASKRGAEPCFVIQRFDSSTDTVDIWVVNVCSESAVPGTYLVSLIVYDI